MRARSDSILAIVRPLLVLLAAMLGTSLLLSGHDEPGGGFVAGLALAIAFVLLLTAGEGARLRTLQGAALAGVVLLLGSLAVPLIAGAPALTHAHGVAETPLGALKWHTALIFDLGVLLAVGGGSGAAATVLWGAGARRDRR